jgi:shikimate kinase
MVIALTGFMLSGKTTYGRAAALQLGLPFYDMDDLIEEQEGMTPKEIFAERGEATFRALELDMLQRMIGREEDFILALGGGVICNHRNRELLKIGAKTIWLKPSLDNSVFSDRWSKEVSRRPLLVNSTKEDIIALFESRVPLYTDVADVILDTDGFSDDENIMRLVLKVKELLNN